jgi:hypothetical protein
MEDPANEKRQENAPQTKSTDTREKEFHEAVEKVYRKYGTDLPAFYRDVQRELVKRG